MVSARKAGNGSWHLRNGQHRAINRRLFRSRLGIAVRRLAHGFLHLCGDNFRLGYYILFLRPRCRSFDCRQAKIADGKSEYFEAFKNRLDSVAFLFSDLRRIRRARALSADFSKRDF